MVTEKKGLTLMGRDSARTTTSRTSTTLRSEEEIQAHDSTLKVKWESVLRKPRDKSKEDVMVLIRDGVVLVDRVWLWLLSNPQKIKASLFNLRKHELRGTLNR